MAYESFQRMDNAQLQDKPRCVNHLRYFYSEIFGIIKYGAHS